MATKFKKNIWDEEYPENMQSIIEKCDTSIKILTKQLNKKNCPTLDSLYYLENGKRHHNKDVFNSLGWNPNLENGELKGLYVFGEMNTEGKLEPVYVGISRRIYNRLKQHGWGKTDNQATLAHSIACFIAEQNGEKHTGLRKHFPEKKRKKEQEKLHQFKVAILPEGIDYDLYFLEVYTAGKLKIKWNTFKTH